MLSNVTTLCAPFVKPGAKILDVGAGHHPFPGVTTILEPYPEPEYDNQRGGPCVVPPGAEVVKGFGEKMPFADKSFDFVVCAETLNHCADPVAVINEMVRVAKAGYIDVPNATHELFEPHPEHLWRVIPLEGNVLGFHRRKPDDGVVQVEGMVGALVWAGGRGKWPLSDCYHTAESTATAQFYIQFTWTDAAPPSGRYLGDEDALPLAGVLECRTRARVMLDERPPIGL